MSFGILATKCRTCLRESVESYFEINQQCHFSADDRNFGEILNFCTHFTVHIDDGLPQRICTVCVQDLQQTYEFLQRVLESEKKFKHFKEFKDRANEEQPKNDKSIKDPLINATDNEYATDNEEDNISELIEHNNYDVEYDNEYSRTSLDNTDNNDEDSQFYNLLISPNGSDDNDDNKDDGNYFKSVESQIFPQGRLKCKICHKAYFTNEGLQAHMDIHLPKDKAIFKSSLIATKYAKKKKFVKSLKDVSDDENLNDKSGKLEKYESKVKIPKPKKMFPCEVCGKQMISASKLRYHMVMHTGEKDYLCTICPKAYSTIYALKHHMRAHTGERPYECKFCGDRFLRPTTLKSHMRRHTGERPYGCDICGKRFIQHSSMATHMKLNHMDKTIPCPYCDKKYARQTDLNTHLLSHSGDKPFACQICPSRFTRQSNLNKHMNQHHSDANSGDKKYKKKTKEMAIDDECLKSPDDPSVLKDSPRDYEIERAASSSGFSNLISSIAPFENTLFAASSITSDLTASQLNKWIWPKKI